VVALRTVEVQKEKRGSKKFFLPPISQSETIDMQRFWKVTGGPPWIDCAQTGL
jgi:hypothetical protein